MLISDQNLMSPLIVIIQGLKDSYHSPALMGWLLFIVFIYLLLRCGARIGVPGFLFLLGIVFMKMVYHTGRMDAVSITELYDTVLFYAFGTVTVCLGIVGALLFRDWLVVKRDSGGARPVVPFAFFELSREGAPKDPGGMQGILFGALGLAGGCFAGFLDSIWPENICVAYLRLKLMTTGELAKILSLYGLYLAFAMFPSIVVWLIALRLKCRAGWKAFFLSHLPIIRVIGAALFLGYSAGSVILYLA